LEEPVERLLAAIEGAHVVVAVELRDGTEWGGAERGSVAARAAFRPTKANKSH